MAQSYDVIIIGAGAAGLFCAMEAGKRGRKVWLIDHSSKMAEKIRISGGGRCNFTNLHTGPECFLSNNPHFCKSALKQYTQYDFIDLVERHGIAYHEKTLGQLFCDGSAKQIITMLHDECIAAGVQIDMETQVHSVEEGYSVTTSRGVARCDSLVIATGGLSIPKIGASKLGYDIARQFGLTVVDTIPALVPLTFQAELLDLCKGLSGVSVDAVVSCGKTQFREGLLFTHRGLSGPSILQISSYWQEGGQITVNLAPDHDVADFLKTQSHDVGKALAKILPARLASSLCAYHGIAGNIAELPKAELIRIANAVNAWTLTPAGSEGYRTAEVTKQGIDTTQLSSKTMECTCHKGLYFIGEVVDVTGHLGGHNFQWAWSSGFVAGRNV